MASHILVVDDDEPVRVMLGRLLQTRGFRVRLAAGAGEARLATAEDRFDLVISDIVMPGETGIELRRFLLGERPDLPVILISGFSDEGPAEFAARTPITWFVPKPFAAEPFMDLVQRTLVQTTAKGAVLALAGGGTELERLDRAGKAIGRD